MILARTQLETYPVGASNPGGVMNANFEELEALAGDNGFARPAYEALAYAASVEVDFDAAKVQEIALTGDLIVTVAGMKAGWAAKLILRTDASLRNLTFPGGIVWVGGAAPATLAANKTLIVDLMPTSALEAGIVANSLVQP